MLAGLYVVYLFFDHIQPEYVPLGSQQSISIKVFREAVVAILPVLALSLLTLGSIFGWQRSQKPVVLEQLGQVSWR